MYQPQSFNDKDHPNWVYKLRNVVYGLKQALRAWYQKLISSLVDLGFSNSK